MVNQLPVLFLVVKKNWKLKSALLCILLIKIDQGEVEIGTCISGLLKAVLEIVMWIICIHMIFVVAAFENI